jgi:hypothetical protein
MAARMMIRVSLLVSENKLTDLPNIIKYPSSFFWLLLMLRECSGIPADDSLASIIHLSATARMASTRLVSSSETVSMITFPIERIRFLHRMHL